MSTVERVGGLGFSGAPADDAQSGLVLTCNALQPAERDEEVVQWTGAKTFQVMPVSEAYGKPHAGRPEGEALPVHMLPHKIQLRMAEAPLVAAKAQEATDPLICKVRVGSGGGGTRGGA